MNTLRSALTATHQTAAFSLFILGLGLASLPAFAGSALTQVAEVTTSWSRGNSDDLFLWQGFDHHWKRFVLIPGLGATPHRLSQLTSRISEENGIATAVMGQSTGVDGNYMQPRLHFSRVEDSGVDTWRGSVHLQWSDTLGAEPYPEAQSRIVAAVPLPEDLVSAPGFTHATALQGITLALTCDPTKQPADRPCNSNGAWAWHVRIALRHCDSDDTTDASATVQVAASNHCTLEVSLDRAWAPTKGGLQIPPVFNDVKPLNARLDMDVLVDLVLYRGQQDRLLAGPARRLEHSQSLLKTLSPQWRDLTSAGPEALTATVIKGLNYTLGVPGGIPALWKALNADAGYRGRYIARTVFNVANPSAGRVLASAGVWSPVTVVDAPVRAGMEVRPLTFGAATKISSGVAEGRLCINSSPQAPAFSRWQKCGSSNAADFKRYGPVRSTDRVRLSP